MAVLDRSVLRMLAVLVPVLVVAACAAAAAPAPASAPAEGSIVFIKKGNVWLMGPDGSRERRVTRGGGWSSPSQSDAGTIVALRKRALVRLTRRGRRIGRPVPLIGTSTTTSGNLMVQAGPARLRVSPDGRLAAYWIGIHHQTCNPVTFLCDFRLQDNVVVTRVDRFTSQTVFGLTRDYREPSWLTNDLLLMFNYGLADTVAIDKVGDGDLNLAPWFSDPQGAQLGGGQAAPRAEVLALLAGTNRAGEAQETIRLYVMPGGAEPPVPVCQISGAAGGAYLGPTWRPDGRALAWVEGDGIHVAAIPELADPALDCTTIRDTRVARGSEPFWGPKPVGRRDGLRR